jgi:hypothetical protein
MLDGPEWMRFEVLKRELLNLSLRGKGYEHIMAYLQVEIESLERRKNAPT